ncbi:MAG: hypothetical protein QOI55_635 [Actinomycetota bacterium]|nr:hypothetical protein [Actinomycetota bacterium]
MPAAVTSHHTAFISTDGGRSRAVRYAVDGDRIVCFGDTALDDLANGARVRVAVQEIAGGHHLTEFSGIAHDIPATDVGANAILELLDHVALGRTAEEFARSLEQQRTRRLVAIAP